MVGLHGSIFQRRQNVSFFEKGVILQNFLMGGSCTKQPKNVGDSDTLPPNAGAPTAFSGLNGDSVKQTGVHDVSKAQHVAISMTLMSLVCKMSQTTRIAST